MNYQRHYDALMARARDRVLAGYKERHHVVPRCLGGGNAKANIVELTAREHFVAHCFLARIHGGGLWVALIRMSGNAKRYINGHLYEAAKRRWAAEIQGNTFGLGHKKSKAARRRISEAQLGEKNHAFGKRLSAEHVRKVAAAMSARRLSPEHRARIAAALRGRFVGQDTRRKQSEWRKGRLVGEKNPMFGKKRPDLAQRNRERAR